MTYSVSKALQSKAVSITISFLLAFTFGLFLYSATTPLGPGYGSDNAIYMTMGTALAHGFRPYVDIFDHKGPVLFLLQLFPQLFGDGYLTITIFIQEVLFLFFSLRIISKIPQLFSDINELIPQILYLCFICRMVDEGNLTEEYANLFSIAAFYFAFRFLLNTHQQTHRQILFTAFIIGLCFAACFLIRANNALPVSFFVLGVFCAFLFLRQFSVITACIPGFLLGCIAVTVPVCLWLIKNGALESSVQASIIHNLLYAETTEEYTVGRIYHLLHSDYGFIGLFFVFVCLLASVVFILREKNIVLASGIFFSAIGALMAAFISHKYYYHYLVLGAPLAAISCTWLFSQFPKKVAMTVSLIVLVPCLVWLIFYCNLTNSRRIEANITQAQFFSDAESLAVLIPDDELDQVYPYRVEPKWYVAAKVLPCCRYYFLQETLADANPAVMDEIVSFFHSSPPLWVVIYNEERAFNPPYDSRIQQIFESYYTQTFSAGDYRLMHLSEDPPEL